MRRRRGCGGTASNVLKRVAGSPADSAASAGDELVASFAQLFFPALPEEQARGQLALMVTALLETEPRRGGHGPPAAAYRATRRSRT
jgi:hypothetical protein